MIDHAVTLELASATAGFVLDIWDGYTVTLDMLSPGSPWTFELWRVEGRRTTWSAVLARAVVGERVTLAIDNLVLLDGTIRSRSVHVARDAAAITISGTDLAGAAMHSDADPSISMRGVTLQAALEKLFEPIGVTLELGEGVDPSRVAPALRPPRRPTRRPSRRRGVIDRFRPRIGETIWQCADSLCRKAGYLLWTAPGSTADRLVLRIDSPRTTGTERYQFLRELLPDGTVSQRSNLLDGEETVSIDGVPTEVTVFADTPRGDGQAARLARTVINDQFVVDQYTRVLPIQPKFVSSARARSDAGARREAARIIGDANAGLRVYSGAVQGHGQVVGGAVLLYQPNELCRVRDDITGTDLAGLLTRVELHGSRKDGQTTKFRVVPRGAIKVDPEDAA